METLIHLCYQKMQQMEQHAGHEVHLVAEMDFQEPLRFMKKDCFLLEQPHSLKVFLVLSPMILPIIVLAQTMMMR